jgi:hypothetical protein
MKTVGMSLPPSPGTGEGFFMSATGPMPVVPRRPGVAP